MTLLQSYQSDLRHDLRDPEAAADYLTAVIEEGDPAALALALQDVAEARALPTPGGDPEALATLKDFLGKAGLRLTVRAA